MALNDGNLELVVAVSIDAPVVENPSMVCTLRDGSSKLLSKNPAVDPILLSTDSLIVGNSGETEMLEDGESIAEIPEKVTNGKPIVAVGFCRDVRVTGDAVDGYNEVPRRAGTVNRMRSMSDTAC